MKEELLTEEQMIEILKSNKIGEQSDFHKKQIFAFAFGEKFMASNDKGAKKKYKEDKSIK